MGISGFFYEQPQVIHVLFQKKSKCGSLRFSS